MGRNWKISGKTNFSAEIALLGLSYCGKNKEKNPA
jgi:hypothetical protein